MAGFQVGWARVDEKALLGVGSEGPKEGFSEGCEGGEWLTRCAKIFTIPPAQAHKLSVQGMTAGVEPAQGWA